MNATGGLTQLLMRTTIRTAINADGSHPAAGQRGDDDAALGTGCGIGVSAGGAAQDAVGAGDDVDVELGVDLQSGQDHVVQLVDVSALVAGVGVLAQIDLNVVGVGEQVSRSTLIKVLGVEDVVHQPLVLQSADGAGSAAQSKAHLDAGLLHVFLQEAVDGQRGAADEMEQLRRGLDSMQGEICGTLRAGFSINYALYRLPDVLASYHKKYPMVRMDIATGHSRHLYQQMLEGNMDLAVLRGEYPWDGTQFLLSQESICLIHSREYKDVPLSDYLYIDHRSDAALGRLERSLWGDPARVLQEIAAMTAGLTERDFAGVTAENAVTAGQKLYLQYGITGVRGQVEAGLPAVRDYGLPALENGLAQGYDLNRSGCGALLAILANSTDTNIIARSSRERQQALVQELKALLTRTPYPDEAALAALDDSFRAERLSPGGSADLLALTYLLYFFKTEDNGHV